MNHKVIFRSVFVTAVALGMLSVGVRSRKDPIGDLPPAVQALRKNVPADSSARPLACYRVSEDGIAGGMDYRGAGYSARVSEKGFQFGSKDFQVQMGAPILEQGGRRIEPTRSEFARDAFGVSRIDHGPFIEGYYFENRRVEQTITLPSAVGQGSLTVRIPVSTGPGGSVVASAAPQAGWNDRQFASDGGLTLRGASGETKMSYHSVLVVDAKDQRLALVPRYEDGKILLELPASYMDQAAYPVVIDPWLELNGSASGGGVSNTQAVSDRPSVAIGATGNPAIAYADNSTGNYEIYVKIWNGFEFRDLGGASTGAGLSADAGRSINPCIVLSPSGLPYVTWQDDSEVRMGIFFKRWNGKSLTWEALDGSASAGGLSTSFLGPAINPKVVVMRSFVNNLTTPFFDEVPLLVWEEGGEIQAFWHYAGDDQPTPGQTGWYELGPMSLPAFAGVGGAAGSPSIARDSLGRAAVAWHDTASGDPEIYVRRLQNATLASTPLVLTGFPAFTTQAFNGVGFDNVVWTGFDNSDISGGISQTPGQDSLYPSIAADGTSLTVAWQEVVGGVGGNWEIYLKRDNGGAWAEVSGSATGGGISQSAGASTLPSVDSAGGLMAVAWVDDTSGNSEIYVRMNLDGVSTTWEQVGSLGSAFPLLPGDTVASAGGISNTANFSLTPTLKSDNFGTPTVIWADGATNRLDIFMKQFCPVGIVGGGAGLRQTFDDPTLVPATKDIPPGAGISQTTVFFSAKLFAENLPLPASTLRLQVEVQEVGTDFTFTPTDDSTPVLPNGIAVVKFTGLPNRSYKWQARAIDNIHRFCPFQSFNGGNLSFLVNAAAPGSPGAGGIVSTRSKSNCGLTGLEGFLLLALLRRRKK